MCSLFFCTVIVWQLEKKKYIFPKLMTSKNIFLARTIAEITVHIAMKKINCTRGITLAVHTNIVPLKQNFFLALLQ